MEYKILARHKWVSDCTITESVKEDAYRNARSIRRFTATIRGWRYWRIYEGPAGQDVVNFVIKRVKEIRDRIDANDKSVFNERNEYATELPITFHLIYTLNEQVIEKEKTFRNFQDAEHYLKDIGATYWEIGVTDN